MDFSDVVKMGKARYIGASKPEHLTDAVTALSLKLEAAEITALEAHYVPPTPS